jgi:hypothetical protein
MFRWHSAWQVQGGIATLEEIMKRALTAVVLLSTLTAPAFAGGDGDGSGFEIGGSFYAPSHNIYCNYYDASGEAGTASHDNGSEIHCARLSPTRLVVILTGHGKMTITHPGKADMEGVYVEKEVVLAYGKSEKNGAHTCTSTQAGMKCIVKGKGFVLSKRGVKKI